MKRAYSKLLIWFAVAAAAAAAVIGCEYPFEIELEESTSLMVVESNIVAGGESTLSVSYSLDEDKMILISECYVEKENGEKIPGSYPGVLAHDPYWRFNTTSLAAGERCRLYAKLKRTNFSSSSIDSSNDVVEVISDWVEVLDTPDIEKLSYNISDDRKRIYMQVTTAETLGSTPYFKWKYSETWEFTANYMTRYRWDPIAQEIIEGPADRFYCWNSGESSELMVGSAQKFPSQRFVDHAIMHRVNTDKKVSYAYRLDVRQYSLTEAAYRYYENLRKNSESVGGLFGQMPTDMAGNIKCITFPDEKVIGYVSASTVKSARLEFQDKDIHFYSNEREPRCERFEFDPETYQSVYIDGYDVLDIITDEETRRDVTYWTKIGCVDCRAQGGTKNKPADWPTSDK